ncbi:uncharacterized protein LOC9630232 isoform X2 [Selaginella moellendorffii]|uniref:uncharacterized protein LOC9630232 isoform X2 n=1 Tax=Selaginella moellendorffii TaxID=88036 RepID=UPI000D1C763A|nr:uncharacterized protein LOC9630232 isoform X2 [Selaginella moellendorffii]|eukprot:XP_024517197.1 uncharacterized protein LOC9630232 isoform X2 [Selaginella moellendorffii]
MADAHRHHHEEERQEEDEGGGDGDEQILHSSKGCCRFLRSLRALVVVTLVLHLGISALGTAMAVVSSSSSGCPRSLLVAAALVASGACARVAWVVGTGLCQAATAVTMIAEEHVPASRRRTSGATSAAIRIGRRIWYRRWLWWGRFGVLVTSFQTGGACYLTILAVRNARSSFCFPGPDAAALLRDTLVILPIATWLLVLAQCCVGSDVLSWRSLYEMQHEAWRAHYREIFDRGIRELLCCLGRSRYLTTMDEDEVDTVAALLGDLVAYRAAGASHLEFLAGVALLRTRKSKPPVPKDLPPAPGPLVTEAALLHPYAVAAYTGPLLDIGRTPLLFPCAWMYRQGLLSLWNRRRSPSVDGDNWWRGHATAFLRAARLPAEALLKGRIHQRNRETVYFVIELKELKLVVVAVRGTETPEDLLTDGLGRECILADADFQGLFLSGHLSDTAKREISSSNPHYGHAGVVAAARELAFELDSPEDNPELSGSAGSSKKTGFLTSILGPGGKCEGFSLRFTGHSLGGSIAAMAGMMLWHRFPNLHTYGYGVLPCVDAVIAEACSPFVTSVVYNDEFASRMSVASLMRLRAASLRALAADSDTSESAVIARVARRLFGSWRRGKASNAGATGKTSNGGATNEDSNPSPGGATQYKRGKCGHKLKGGAFLCYHACHCVMGMPKGAHGSSTVVMGRPVGSTANGSVNGNGGKLEATKVVSGEVTVEENGSDGMVASLDAGSRDKNSKTRDARDVRGDELGSSGEFLRGVVSGELLSNGIPGQGENGLVGFKPGSDLQEIWPVELVMPGLVIHLVRVPDEAPGSSWFARRRKKQHQAILRDRDDFRDLVVSPSMFLDHMPWRCQRGLDDVLKQVCTRPLHADAESQGIQVDGF